MNDTQNYHLPQWEAEDFIKRDDFNDAFAAVDAALQSCSYVTGTYEGNGGSGDGIERHITLGFHPSFVIVTYVDLPNPYSTDTRSLSYVIAGNTESTSSSRLTANGFVAKNESYELNKTGFTYCYLAFR